MILQHFALKILDNEYLLDSKLDNEYLFYCDYCNFRNTSKFINRKF